MNPTSGHSVTLASDALAALRPAPSSQASNVDAGATLAFEPAADPAARVLSRLDGLTSSLENGAVNDHKRPQAALDAHADEEGLESYLQRYMQQLTGKKQEPAITEGVAAVPAKHVETATPEPPQPQRQPAQAPEDRLRITAMRELANDSARRAVAACNNSQLNDRIRMNYFVTKAASIVSIVLVVGYFATHSSVALASAAVTFGLAMLCACRFALFCRRMGPAAEQPA